MTNEQCTDMMGGMMGNMMNGMMGGMMGPMMLGMVLFWTLVIVVLVLLVRQLWGRRPGSTSSAITILQERFARGEMDREEYQQRLSTLQARSASDGAAPLG